MSFDARMAAHETRLFKNRCGTLNEICRHDDAACNKVSAALQRAYAAGLARAAEIARGYDGGGIAGEKARDVADAINAEREKSK